MCYLHYQLQANDIMSAVGEPHALEAYTAVLPESSYNCNFVRSATKVVSVAF